MSQHRQCQKCGENKSEEEFGSSWCNECLRKYKHEYHNVGIREDLYQTEYLYCFDCKEEVK